MAKKPQVHLGLARRAQEWPQVMQEQARAVAELQEKPLVAAKPQETLQAVVEPKEVKVSGVAK